MVLILLGSLLVLRTGGNKLTCYSRCLSNCEQKRRRLIISCDLIPFMMLACVTPVGLAPGPSSPRLRVLTARLLADDAVCAVPAGPRLPQATVALDPEAGVWRQHGQGHLVRLPVAVGHLFILAPHQPPACSRDTWTRSFKPSQLFICRSFLLLLCLLQLLPLDC